MTQYPELPSEKWDRNSDSLRDKVLKLVKEDKIYPIVDMFLAREQNLKDKIASAVKVLLESKRFNDNVGDNVDRWKLANDLSEAIESALQILEGK